MRYHKTDKSLSNTIHSEIYVGNYYSEEVGQKTHCPFRIRG
ncbi:hypothetical protein LX87_04785 [Larkinella arboricola]|uniref:Uncharacterized protein n=1 Tax=Larkinella arboricola TaxID=643671 RepID=A0A327WMP4_LARAB|nr:hypothetical protein LX87_04785 [Larkinella arboricola]